MDFIKITKSSTFLDPLQGFTEVQRLSEVRTDPLTGHTTRILDFPIKQLIKADLSSLIKDSKAFCPFCPGIREQVTPKFSPTFSQKERFAKGQALCVPNAFPYDENGALTIMSYDHFIGLADFSHEILSNALQCCIEFLDHITIKQPDAIYQSINWNYLPLAGGSLLHPHLQIMASSSPTNYYRDTLSALLKYKDKNGNLFWNDLAREEQMLGERFIAKTDTISWTTAFAPMGAFDVIGILDHIQKPINIKGNILHDLTNGILSILKFIDSLNLYSFNMSLYFIINNEVFIPHLRICPRVSLPPFGTSEINYMRMLHNETLTTIKPEEVCREIKSFFTS